MNSVLPVYYQIKQTIKNWIINKEFIPGEKIPTEIELANMFSVNRLTVRQAISQLNQEGFLISKRGEGTFVTENQDLISRFSLEFSGFMDDLFYQCHKSITRSAEISKIVPPRSIRDKLELDSEDVEVFQTKRVRFRDERSFAYNVNYLPIQIGNKIKKKELRKKSMLQILEKDLGIQFTEAFQVIEASFADQEIAEKLEIPSGSPILFSERIMYTKRRKPVEVVHTSYRGDFFKYVVRLRNVKRKNGSIWMHQLNQVNQAE